MTARYTLTETKSGRVLARGSDTASESYTFVRYLVASNASYNNAIKNSLTVLSEKISTRAIVATHSLTSGDETSK